MIKPQHYLLATVCTVLLVGSTSQAWSQQAEEAHVEADISASTEIEQSGRARSSSIVLETTSVTGSRELPKVLVIVPWKTSEALGPGERPLASLVEEALTPLDPDEFRREIDYYTELNDSSNESSGSATTPAESVPAEAGPE